MGIDIYLNGYEAHEARVASIKGAFDEACAQRDKLPENDSTRRKAAQERVSAAYQEMYSGKVGYIRSSYNGSGLFRVLEEIFGFDVGAYLFPGDWDAQGDGIQIDGAEFCDKVVMLGKTLLLAQKRNQLTLPWINEFTEVSGQRAPDANPARTGGEAFGDMVFGLISQVADVDHVTGGPEPPSNTLNERHHWYLTAGLTELFAFGMLAKKLNEQGERTFAYISF